jgi:hypothetical protein
MNQQTKKKTMNNKWIILAIAMCIFPPVAFAQKKVEGVIVNLDGERLPNVTVSEIFLGSNRLGKTTVSDDLGEFGIDMQQNDSYLYVVSIGYNPQTVTLEPEQTTVRIELGDADYMLDEIIVTAQKQAIQLKTDRIVFDMSANPLKSHSALEALKFVPLVIAGEAGFSIMGKDATLVYVNGRKSNLNATALKSYLESLPAGDIKNIEVITTPNSSFRGEGNFGIINIQLKTGEDEGLKGSLAGQLWKTHYFKNSESLNLNWQKNKLATNLSAGITKTSDWKATTIEAAYKQEALNTLTNTVTDGANLSYFVNWATDYRVGDNSTVGFTLNASLADGRWSESGHTGFGTPSADYTDSIIGIDYESKSYIPEMNANVNYRFNPDDSKQYFFVDFDYLNNFNRQKSQNIMNYLDENHDYLSVYKDFEQETPQKSAVWSLKMEYGKQFDNQLNLTLGTDAYYSVIDNDDQYRIRTGDDYEKDLLKSNNFRIKEWTPALFVQVQKNWNTQVSTALGSRLEYTNYEGMQYTQDERFERNYLKWLPTFYFAWNPNVNHNLNYDFSVRIIRPAFNELNPFKKYTSPTSYTTGNPYLNPSRQMSHNLQYVFGRKYYLTASYYDIDDVINKIDLVRSDNLIENKSVNLGKQNQFRLSFNANFSYLQRGFLNSGISYNRMQSQGKAENVELDYTIESVNVNINNHFDLSNRHNISLDLGGSYSSKQKYANRDYPPYLGLNMQLNKTIGNCNVSLYGFLSSYIYDGKWTQVWKLGYDTGDLQTVTYRKGESSSVGVRFSYSFGNSNVKGARQRNTSNAEVKSRVK